MRRAVPTRPSWPRSTRPSSAAARHPSLALDGRVKPGHDGVFRAIVFAALVAATPAWAISDPAEALREPAAESRAVAIGKQLRCLVCQNESIEDSGADLARDLRLIVRQRVTAGDSDLQITDWLVARYGNFVRLSPPLNAATILLWASPALALLAGGGAVLLSRRRRAAPPPLDAGERARLEHLLNP